jgi:hypothetical protein
MTRSHDPLKNDLKPSSRAIDLTHCQVLRYTLPSSCILLFRVSIGSDEISDKYMICSSPRFHNIRGSIKNSNQYIGKTTANLYQTM